MDRSPITNSSGWILPRATLTQHMLLQPLKLKATLRHGIAGCLQTEEIINSKHHTVSDICISSTGGEGAATRGALRGICPLPPKKTAQVIHYYS